MADRRRTGNSLPEDLRRRLDQAHGGLLRVHKALLDHERSRYERERGRIGGPGEFLELVINDPWFAWLHAVSELAVQIYELTSSKEPAEARAGEALLAKARDLIAPSGQGNEFQRQYLRSVQESPEVAGAHAEWRRLAGGWEPRAQGSAG